MPGSRPRPRLPRRSPAVREVRVGSIARLDRGRGERLGIPELVLAEGKRIDHLLAIVRHLAAEKHGALISRPSPPQLRRLRVEARRGLPLRFLASGRLVRLAGPLSVPRLRGLPVILLAAGTSDVPIAEECRAVLTELGARPVAAYDVGVAGLHRLLRVLARLERLHPAAYLVFAGREGALPTVVAGLVRAPVLGIPVSVGYGRGGRGEAALNAMLQSCAPIAVVNIDAAVPAALWAARLVGRLAPSPPR